MLGGMYDNLHFLLPSMNRLDQTEPATFSILLFYAFFKNFVFLYFILQQCIYLLYKEHIDQVEPIHFLLVDMWYFEAIHTYKWINNVIFPSFLFC
jgi:hypothetical protein